MRSYRSPWLAMVALSVIINAGLTVAQTNSRAPTQAQASTDLEVGDIAVAVSDASGAVVPNAIVQVTTEIGQVRVLGTTDETGLLRSELPAGSYKLEVWAKGFITTVERVNAEAGRTTVARIQLVTPHVSISPSGGERILIPLYPPTETKLDPIPYITIPRRPNFFQRTFGALFHKLGF